jgi:hypothetical protein
MTQQDAQQTSENTEVENLIQEDERLAEALYLHSLNGRRFKNLRQLEVLSGYDAEELKKKVS